MDIQINVKALQNTDEARLLRLRDEAVHANTLMGSAAWPWFVRHLERRERHLHQLLVNHSGGEGEESQESVKGRLKELAHIRDGMVVGRVQQFKQFRQALNEYLADTNPDDEE